MNLSWVAKTSEGVSIKPIDFYSLGHIILGMISHLISTSVSLFFTTNLYIAILFGVVISFIISLSWEIFENNWLIHTRIKNLLLPTNKRKQDSLSNSLADQVFVLIGIALEVVLFITNSLEVIFYGNLGILNTIMWIFYWWRKKTIGNGK